MANNLNSIAISTHSWWKFNFNINAINQDKMQCSQNISTSFMKLKSDQEQQQVITKTVENRQPN